LSAEDNFVSSGHLGLLWTFLSAEDNSVCRRQFCLQWTFLSAVDRFVWGGHFCLRWTVSQEALLALATGGQRHCSDVFIALPTPQQNARKTPMVHRVSTALLRRFAFNQNVNFT
jgi:hypothetical protein